jgi:uncharacterized protein
MAVILDLRDLEEFPAQLSLESETDQIKPFREDVLAVGSTQVELSVQKSGDEFFCQGAVVGTVTVECARCLAPVEITVSGRADFVVTTEEARREYSKEGQDNEEYVLMDPNDMRADLTDLVGQTLLLELPMKPVCTQECKGLRTPGGVGLSPENDAERKEEVDPRWEGLKNLLREKPEKGQN